MTEMDKHRCFIDPAQWSQPEVMLSPEESRHIARVLRMQPGDVVMLMDGQGYTALAVILAAGPDGVRVQIQPKTRRYEAPSSVAITLIQALPKHARMDWIVQKATELGTRAVWPMLTERVIVRTGCRDVQGRCDRWRKIAREAGKQSGGAWVPDIRPVMTLSAILPRLAKFTFPFVASLHAEARPFRDVVNSVSRQTPLALALIIGPEGDFTAEETLALKKAGGLLVRFGPITLRTETAALYGLSVLAYAFSAAYMARG